MLILTIVMTNNGMVRDIMVKPEQRIRDVLSVLADNGQILCAATDQLLVRSWRLGRIVNECLTFKQVGIQAGDILYIEVDNV